MLVMLGVASPLVYPLAVRLYVVGVVAFMTLIVPVVVSSLMNVWSVRNRGGLVERNLSVWNLLLMGFCLVACGWVFDDILVLYPMRKVLYTLSVVPAVLLAAEMFYPLSLHTAMVGGALGIMWMMLVVGNVALLTPFLVFIVAAGVVVSARLVLANERVLPTVLGLVVGFASTALITIFI